VLQSPETAEDAADYVEVAEFPAQAQAKSCVDEAKRRLSGQLQGSEATQHLLHIKPFVWASGGENADAVNALAVAGISEPNREFAGVVLGLGDAQGAGFGPGFASTTASFALR